MTNKNYYHYIFLGIISINYFFPYFIFGSITAFYHDNFDSLVVYNKIIGEIYRDGFNFDHAKIFLAGELEFYYLRHIFKPFVIIYSLFDPELAYWITDFLFKITSYISFYCLSKKIQKNNFISFIGASLFSCLAPFTTLGFGLAIFPYLFYLIIYKSKLTIKHYLVVVFFGLNTDIVADIFFVPTILILIFLIDKRILITKISNIIKILSLFFICSILTSANLIYLQFLDFEMHRIEFTNHAKPFLNNLLQTILNIFKFPNSLNWSFLKVLPYSIVLAPMIIIILFSKNNITKKLLVFSISIHLLIFLFDTKLIINFSNNNIIKMFNPFWISYYLPLVHSLMLVYLIKDSNANTRKCLVFLSCISIFLFQLNSSIIPIQKKIISKEKDYRNIYTFNEYFLYDDYKKIKQIVKKERILSINLDPMVAVMSDINVIDGYHAIYPLSYKIKFRKVIEKELKNNKFLKNYYDNWGSRIYAFNDNPENILINFKEAKKIGAKYILSKNNIDNDQLLLACDNCSKYFKLYKIK